MLPVMAAIPALVEAAPAAAAALPTLAELGPLLVTYGPLLLQAPTIINGFVDIARRIHGTYQETAANAPAARHEALQQFREESRQNHEESVRKMEELHQRIEQTAKVQEEAADRRIRQQRRETNEALNSLLEKMKKDEDKRDENMRKMKKEHEEKLKEIQTETREERQKMEREHADKMETMEKEHKEEKREAERKLEEARNNAAESIREAEKEKERVVMERDQAQNQFKEEMETLTRKNDEQIQVIQNEIANLRNENSREERRQLEERNLVSRRQIQEQTAHYLSHVRLETNRGVITHFQMLLEPIYDITNALDAVHNQCSPAVPGLEVPIIVPIGNLDAAFEVMRTQKAVYHDRLMRYQNYVRQAYHVHPEIHEACRNLIPKMTDNIGNQDMSALLYHLPSGIDSGNNTVISHYGRIAGVVKDQFRVLCATVGNQLDEVTLHLHEQEVPPDSNVGAVENNILE